MVLADIRNRIVYFYPSGKTRIPIHPIRVSNTRSKKLRKRTPSTSSQNIANGPANTKIRDKLKIKNVYEVDGWIESIDSSDTDAIYFPNVKTAAELKKEFIKYVFNNEVNYVMYYEGYPYFGAIEKLDITETAMDKDSTYAPRFEIKFIFIAKENAIYL